MLLVVALPGLLAASCTKTNEDAKPCDSHDDCASGICDLEHGVCVDSPDAGAVADANGEPDAILEPDAEPECETSSECSAATAPICGAGGICRACDSPEECADLDPLNPECADDGQCVQCTESTQCTETLSPICDDGGLVCRACESGAAGDAECAARGDAADRCHSSGACVQCLDSADCEVATSPICDPGSNTCRACVADVDCASEICEEDSGACVAQGDVVYVSITGADGATCGAQANPCRTISGASGALAKVTNDRRWVRVRAGTYTETVSVSGTVTLVGDGASTTAISSTTSNQPNLTAATNADVTVEGFTLTGAAGGTSAHGARCSTAQLTIKSSVIQNNQGCGVYTTGCFSLTLQDSVIRSNVRQGIYAIIAGGELEVERSDIHDNEGGGMAVVNGTVTVVNSFVVDNGAAATTSIGGVQLSGSAGGVAFTTVAGNLRDSGASVGGIECINSATASVSNSIIWGNTAQDLSGCSSSYSDVEGGTGGVGNINSNPAFSSSASGNYHLTSGSPCRNAADLDATEEFDFDGETRPEGARCDMGADEFWP